MENSTLSEALIFKLCSMLEWIRNEHKGSRDTLQTQSSKAQLFKVAVLHFHPALSFPVSHLNASIYHCLAVAAKSFLRRTRGYMKNAFWNLGKQLAAVSPYLLYVCVSEWILSSKSNCDSCFSTMSTCHLSSHDANCVSSNGFGCLFLKLEILVFYNSSTGVGPLLT